MGYTIQSVNGPVITAKGDQTLTMLESVRVGHESLLGEVVNIRASDTVIQVYEDTSGLCPGQPVVSTGGPMTVELGPGLLNGIFDGILRPLKTLEKMSGSFITRGVNIGALDPEKKWDVKILVREGDTVEQGTIYAECRETGIIMHYCISQISGVVTEAKPDGGYTVSEPLVEVKTDGNRTQNLYLRQQWPIRTPRPIKGRKPINKPLVTGQRVIDALFPIAKGGCAAMPGPFGAGKTIMQHQLAKWSDADIIIYLGCGERGNEMTEVLEEFTKLSDPRSGLPLLDRTVLIANTSNMPVAAREASVYTGMTIAEYYRDMGYHVAIMADSTSRWAEAMREISGRLEEMPAEEGYPAYLPSRLAEFYERAGYITTLSGSEGSVTVIGAVSPQGGDFSEPFTQNTKRFVRTFWALDRQLAYARHFPAINWITSYSEYTDDLEPWYRERLGRGFIALRTRISRLLLEESKLMEIVKLIGSDVLPDDQKLIIEATRVLRLGFLQQNAYHETDTYVPIEKQKGMLEVYMYLYDAAKILIDRGIPIGQLRDTGIYDDLIRLKFDVPNDSTDFVGKYRRKIDGAIRSVLEANL